MNDKPSSALLAAMASTKVPQDKLDALRAKASVARELEATIQDLEQRLSDAKAQRTELMTRTLPEMMDLAGVPAIELEASGNMPAIRLENVPYISANIAASWEEPRRQAAFQWLDANDAGDLIKTTMTIQFPRSHRAEARDALIKLRQLHLEPEVKETVHQQTLTAWLKETIEEGHAMPPLDVIGGSVGRIVKLKQLKVK